MKPESLSERVILLDAEGRPMGEAEKLDAHIRGLRHLALSVFLFDRSGRLLVQRRAAGKYHSPLKWANSVCSHPRPGEPVEDAASRRVREELGVSPQLAPFGTYAYRADVGGGLIEHELCHLFVGTLPGEPVPNPIEVAETKWVSRPELDAWSKGLERESLTPWFQLYIRDLTDRLFEGLVTL